MPEESRCIEKLRDKLEYNILSKIPNAHRNGALHQRLPNNSSFTFPGIDAEALIVNTPRLAISTGSACTSGAPEPSHVLEAIGLMREDAYSTIRIGLGRFTTIEEIETAVELLSIAYQRLSSLSQSNRT
jgi:cysteine desulfurase